MQEVSRNNVDIDVCPSCHGVWLDRGELEKLLSAVKNIKKKYDDTVDIDLKDDNIQSRKKKNGLFEMFDIF